MNLCLRSNSEFHLKIKESLLISRDQPILNKNELVNVSYDYLVIINIHRLQFIFYCLQ